MKQCVICWSLTNRSSRSCFESSTSTGITNLSWQHLITSWLLISLKLLWSKIWDETSTYIQKSRIWFNKSSIDDILLKTADVADIPLFLSSWSACSFIIVNVEVCLMIVWISLIWSFYLLSIILCSCSRRTPATSSFILKSRSILERLWSTCQRLNSYENIHMISICLYLLSMFCRMRPWSE